MSHYHFVIEKNLEEVLFLFLCVFFFFLSPSSPLSSLRSPNTYTNSWRWNTYTLFVCELTVTIVCISICFPHSLSLPLRIKGNSCLLLVYCDFLKYYFVCELVFFPMSITTVCLLLSATPSSLSLSLSVWMAGSLSVCLSVCLSLFLYLLSLSLSVSLCLSVSLSLSGWLAG